jgi:hypothetical protein
MNCPTSNCPLELASLPFKWLGRKLEAPAAYTCPKRFATFVRLGNKVTRVKRREITLDR